MSPTGTVGNIIGLVKDFATGNASIKTIVDQFDVGKILKIVTDKVGSINVDDVRNSIQQTLSEKLAPVKSVPEIKEIYGISGEYLSRTKAEELRENLSLNKAGLEKIPSGLMSAYRDESLQLIKKLSVDLEKYEKCFDVLTEGKIFRFSRSKSIDYDKIWAARKDMKKYLSNMKKLLDDYNRVGTGDAGMYTFEVFKKRVNDSNEKIKAEAKKVLARMMFANAYESIYGQLFSAQDNSTNLGIVKIWHDPSVVQMSVGELLRQYKDKDIMRSALEQDLLLVDGVTDFTSSSVPEFKETLPGPKRCLERAEQQIRDKHGDDPFAYCGINAKEPFMGDYTVKIADCIKKTQDDLDKEINLGARKANLNIKTEATNCTKEPQGDPNKDVGNGVGNAIGSLGIDLSVLLGDNYKQYVKDLEKQKGILDTAVTKNLIKRRGSLHSKVEREYKKIVQYMSKHFPGSNPKDAPIEGEEYYNFSKFKVNMTSSSSGEDKEYDIAKRHEELEKDYTAALSKSERSIDYTSLYIRKAEKFLKACEVWNKMRHGYGKLLDARKVTAKDWLKKVKKHYQELKSTSNLNENALDKLKEKYSEFPVFSFTFVKNYRDNVKKSEKFCEYKVDSNGSIKFS